MSIAENIASAVADLPPDTFEIIDGRDSDRGDINRWHINDGESAESLSTDCRTTYHDVVAFPFPRRPDHREFW